MSNTKTIAKPIYVAMWNLPGCLPEMEPLRTFDEDEARNFLADDLEKVADEIRSDPDPFADAEELSKVADEIGEGARDIREGKSDCFFASGYNYTIEEA